MICRKFFEFFNTAGFIYVIKTGQSEMRSDIPFQVPRTDFPVCDFLGYIVKLIFGFPAALNFPLQVLL